jgi:dipeptidyl aminopeptidase/acylaminoacyl peptidase
VAIVPAEPTGEGHEYRRADSRKRLLGAMLRFLEAHLTA